MNSLQLLNNKKEILLISILLLIMGLFSYSYQYIKYKKLIFEEIYEDTFQIVNIYDKQSFYTLKLQNSDFVFFTSIDKFFDIEKLDYIKLSFLTKNISFIEYLKGFYAKSVYYNRNYKKESFRRYLNEKIYSSHSDKRVSELFSALFLAIPISKESRSIYTNLGISHLIAISGFHLGILIFICYWLSYIIYLPIYKKFFIYRNIKFDILIFSSFLAFLYLYMIDLVPSLLRSFIMFCLGLFLLRSNIKLLSFKTLLLTLLIILALFPTYLFSLSLWFSIAGVFYIFLYIQYFSKFPKIISILFFNIWIFLVFNPIVHFFFTNTTYEQFFSPLLTLLFTIFYPVELFLHIIGEAQLFDTLLQKILDYEFYVFNRGTSLEIFIVYILISISAIVSKKLFIILNFLFLIFNIIIYIY